jgi:hypothetical protein
VTTGLDPRLILLEEESPQAARLAELASLAVRVDTGLLRRLRRAFLPDADVDVESDLWFSAIVESRSETGFQIDPEVLALLRARLKSRPGPPTIASVRSILAAAHAEVSPAIQLEEEVNGIALEHREEGREKIDEALRPALTTLAQGGSEAPGIARWALHAAPRLDPIVRDTPNARTLLLASALLLRTRPRFQGRPESELRISQLGWALPPISSLKSKPIGVAFVPGGLQFQDASIATTAIDLPPTEPAVVEIEWQAPSAVRHVLAEAAVGVLVPLEGDPPIVTVTTLEGDQYRLTAESRLTQSPNWRFVSPRADLLRACIQVEPLGHEGPLCLAFAIGPRLLLTPSEIVKHYPFIAQHERSIQFRVMHWGPSESDEGYEDALVGLRPVDEVFDTFLPVAVPVEDTVRAAVAGFDWNGPRWFDVTVQPRMGGSSGIRRGVLLDPPRLTARELTSAFVGAPLVVDGKAIGAVVGVEVPGKRESYATLDLVEGSYLQSVSVRARLKADQSAETGNTKNVYSVMLSSTYAELADHRRAVREAMLSQRLLPVAMEDDGARPDQDLFSASLSKVDEADAYVGLIGYRYGQIPISHERNPNQLSITELEFRRAVDRGIPICMFIMHGDHLVSTRAVNEERGAARKLEAFLNLAKKDRVYAEFKSVEDLRIKAVHSLVALREALERRAASSARDGRGLALSNIPIAVPRHFLGRDDALQAIDTALKRDAGRGAITALHGMRGVGKTTLAAAYAERHRADYRAIWWIRAQTEATMRADLVALGVRLGWVAADEKEEPALVAVRERLRYEGEGILLIYDNAIDATSLTQFLPVGSAARVLVTSNLPTWRAIATPVEIEVWPKEVGADYLIARTGRDKERAEGEALSEALGGLPMAHEQAAAYCERLDVSLGEYRKRFEAAPVRLLNAEKDAPAEYHNKLTVAKAFDLAIDEAAKLHPAADPLIIHAALLAPQPIPLFLFSEGREKFGEPLASQLANDGLDEAVAALRAFTLVDREMIADEQDPAIRTETIRLHPLVRSVAAQRLQGSAAQAARRDLIEAMAAVYPQRDFDDPSTLRRARWLEALVLDLVGGAAVPPRGAEISASGLLSRLGQFRAAAKVSP